MEIIKAGFDFTNVNSWAGFAIFLIGSYGVYILKNIRQDWIIHTREHKAEKELFREYKRTNALAVQELFEKKNEFLERITKLETEIENLKEEK